MLKSSLCSYIDAHIIAKVTISIVWVLALAQPENIGKKVLFKDFAPFTDEISEINNT